MPVYISSGDRNIKKTAKEGGWRAMAVFLMFRGGLLWEVWGAEARGKYFHEPLSAPSRSISSPRIYRGSHIRGVSLLKSMEAITHMQRWHSTKHSLQSSELGLPHPSQAGECVPPPLWFRGRDTLACGRGGGGGGGGPNSDEGTDMGRVPIRTRVQTCSTLGRYTCTLCLYPSTFSWPAEASEARRNNLKLINNVWINKSH